VTATIALAIPVEAFTILAAPPALVTNHNPEHVGLTRRVLLAVFREMVGNPRFAPEVVIRGKIRGAPPAAIVAYLREQTAHASRSVQMAPEAANDDDALDAEARRSIGVELVAPAQRSTASGRKRSR
jgi:hypothetical protein